MVFVFYFSSSRNNFVLHKAFKEMYQTLDTGKLLSIALHYLTFFTDFSQLNLPSYSSSYICFFPERSGISLWGSWLHQSLSWGHPWSQGICQAVSWAPCQTKSQPTTAAAGWYFCFGGIFPSEIDITWADRCGIVLKKESTFEYGCVNIETINNVFLKTVDKK